MFLKIQRIYYEEAFTLDNYKIEGITQIFPSN